METDLKEKEKDFQEIEAKQSEAKKKEDELDDKDKVSDDNIYRLEASSVNRLSSYLIKFACVSVSLCVCSQ